MDRDHSSYIDDYATCAETFVALRILHFDLDPGVITEEMGIEPSETQRAKESGGPGAAKPAPSKAGGWFLSSSGKVHSRDVRRHIDWLLDRLEPRSEVIGRLRTRGFRMDVSCYWLSATGQGGPTLSATNMGRLASLGLDLWFDIYLLEDDVPEA